MLNDKLRLFYDLMNDAVAVHGLNAKAVADAIIAEAFPDTLAAASHEGADTMLRNGVIDFLSSHFKRAPKHDPQQFAFDFPEHVKSIVAKLKGEAHYVETLGRYVPNALLITNPEWLDDARKYKRRKGEEVLSEAAILDELYEAVTGGASA